MWCSQQLHVLVNSYFRAPLFKRSFLEKAAQENLLLRQNGTQSFSTEGLSLAAVFTAANISTMKPLTTAPTISQPSTSGAPVMINSTVDVAVTDSATTRMRQRKQQFNFTSPQESIKFLGSFDTPDNVAR